jgi:hypothetical protein
MLNFISVPLREKVLVVVRLEGWLEREVRGYN